MDLGIRGRKAIINGGSAGLGFGSARALAKEGVDLVISARGEERLVRVCQELAAETGVILVEDILSEVLSDDALRADRIHPNAEGYAIFTEGLAGAMQRIGLLE